MLGFFNVPIRRDDHVARAITAAKEIQLAVPEINLGLGQEDLLKVGIGITTGLTLTTTVGSNDCKDYTVMGDVANFASRLESLAGPERYSFPTRSTRQSRAITPMPTGKSWS